MADNVNLSSPSGTVGADDVGGVLIQRVKVTWGPDGTANDVDAADGKTLPVTIYNEDGTLVPFTDQLAAAFVLSDGFAPVALPDDQSTLAVAQDTSRVVNGTSGTVLTPKFAAIAASSSGANTVVSAVTSKKIRVLAAKLVANAAVNAKWQSHDTPTDLTGLSYFGAQGDGEVLPFNPVGWFETVAGEALDINLSGAVAVGGHITYVEV